METRLLGLFTLLVLLVAQVESKMQDLTHYFDNHTIKWPGHKPWIYNIHRGNFETPTGKNLWLENNDFSTAEHMGTHIDAPAHLYNIDPRNPPPMPGVWRLDEIPLENLIRPLCVIDMRKQAKATRDYALTVDDIQRWEGEHGRIPDGAAVFAWSGWDEFWFKHDRASYLGSDSDDIWSLHSPGFSEDAAKWLVAERKIKGIGMDCVSFDVGNSREFPVHTHILPRNVWGLENVAHLGKVPPTGATVHVMPMNIWQASGAPSRVVAFWGDDQSGSFYSGAPATQLSRPIMVLLAAAAAVIGWRMA